MRTPSVPEPGPRQAALESLGRAHSYSRGPRRIVPGLTQWASLPQQIRNRSSEWVVVRAGGTFETQAVRSHCIYSNRNLCSMMQILRSWCQSVLNKRILVWRKQNLSWEVWLSGFPSCTFEHLPLTQPPPVGSFPKVDTNFEENFSGCLPVTEVKESAEYSLSRSLK